MSGQKIYRTTEGAETWDKNGCITESEIKYYVVSPESKRAAMQACYDDAPACLPTTEEVPEVLGVLGNDTVTRRSKSGVRFEGIDGDGNYEISVLYEKSDSSDGGGGGKDSEEDTEEDTKRRATMSFDCGGGTKHVTSSIGAQTILLEGSPDPGTAVGWNGKPGPEMAIAGVDIPTAQLRESWTIKKSVSKARDTAFRRKVAAMVGKVNSSSFHGWEAGEVMFLGMSLSIPEDKEEDEVNVTFNFAIQPNETRSMFGSKFVSKKGFEYIWAISETVIGESGGKKIPELKVKGMYKATVCESADFSGLGV